MESSDCLGGRGEGLTVLVLVLVLDMVLVNNMPAS